VRIDTALNPDTISRLPEIDLSGTTCVVFDVLRATSSIVTGLAHGVASIYPVRTIPEALDFASSKPGCLLAGERHGDPISGFHLGNSPEEFTRIRSASVVQTTTNGTIALQACASAKEVYAAAFLNLGATLKHLQLASPERVLLVCAGTFDGFAYEDGVAAGQLVLDLPAAELSDESEAVRDIAVACEGNWASKISQVGNGRVLADAGRGKDLAWCLRRDIYPLVAPATFEEGRLVFRKDYSATGLG